MVTEYYPPIGSTRPSTTVLSLTFSENVQKGSGNFTVISDSDHLTHAIINVSSSAVAITNNVVNITIPTLLDGRLYHVKISPSALDGFSTRSYAGITDRTWNFTTSLGAAPTLVSLTPADDATEVDNTRTTLVMVFNENVQPGAGTITVTRLNDGFVQSFQPTDLFYDGKTVTITVAPLGDTQAYVVDMPSGALLNFALKPFAGLTSQYSTDSAEVTALWNFYTAGSIVPTVVDFFPRIHTLVAVGTELRLTFSENIAKGTGNITVYSDSNGQVHKTLNLTSNTDVGIVSTVATLTIPKLGDGRLYHVIIAPTVFDSFSKKDFAGILDNTWNFTTTGTGR